MARLFSIFLSIVSLYSSTLIAQECQNPQYVCNKLEPVNFPLCGNQITTPAIVNNSKCHFGAIGVNFGCGVASTINQSWFSVEISQLDGNPLILSITNSANARIGASITFAINNQYSVCNFLNNFPSSCQYNVQSPQLTIQNPQVGGRHLLVVSNTSNQVTDLTIQCISGGRVTICLFDPVVTPCQLPTAEVVSEDRVVEVGHLYQPAYRFTGNGPWVYSYENRAYDLYTENEYVRYDSYPNRSFTYKLGYVRNNCGEGRIIGEGSTVLVYEDKNILQSCFPIDGDINDKLSGNKGLVNGATLGSDRFGKPNSSYIFDGNDNIKFSGKNYISKDYIYSLWVKSSVLPTANQLQKIMCVGSKTFEEQYIGIQNDNETDNLPKYVFYSKLRNGTTKKLFINSVPNHPNQWVHLVAVKSGDTLKFMANNQTIVMDKLASNFITDYGNSPKLMMGSGLDSLNFYKGSIDEIKIFTGKLSDSLLYSLYTDRKCSIKYCNTIETPTVTMPGYIYLLPSTQTYTENLPITPYSNNNNYQIGNNLLQHEGGGTIDFSAKRKSDGVFEYLTHISNECGTGRLLDTLVITNAPKLVNCFSFDKSANDYFDPISTYSYISDYGPDRFMQDSSAILFNKSDASVNITANHPLAYSNEYSMFAWIKLMPSTFSTNQKYTIAYWNSSIVISQFYIERNIGTNKWYLTYMRGFSLNDPIAPKYAVEIPDLSNKWHFVGVTYHAGRVQIILNGEIISNQPISPYHQGAGQQQIIIGKTSWNADHFQGYMDDFKLFGGVLNYTQIQKIYASNKCDVELCDEIPDFSLSYPKEINYAEPFEVELKFTKTGPWEYVAPTTTGYVTMGSSEKKTKILYGTTQKIGENEFTVQAVRNHCGVNKTPQTIKYYVKPTLNSCYQLDNSPVDNLRRNDLVLSNVIGAANRFNQADKAIYFNGVNSSASMPLANYHKQDFSVSFWVRPSVPTSFQTTIFQLGSLQNYLSINTLRISNEESSLQISVTSTLFNSFSFTLPTTIKNNVWQHILLTFSTEKIIVYLNGSLSKEYVYYNPNKRDLGQQANVSGMVGQTFNNNYRWVGIIDDLKFFNGILNSGEVISIANSIDKCNFNYCSTAAIRLTETITNDGFYQTNDRLESNSKINANVQFFSKNVIELKPSFETYQGQTFKAEIKQCPN